MPSSQTALVVGAHGVIGRTLVQHLAATGEWDVIGVSRRGGDVDGRVRHVAVDLLDPAAAREGLAPLREVTHVFHAAYQDRPAWSELVEPNVTMLRSVLDGLEPVADDLRHVQLMQGYKVYGAHLGPFKTPAREDDPGHMPPEFNVAQQELLEARAADAAWTWSALRPSVVGGTTLGNPMNLAVAIAVYATMARRLGVPMRFPGKPGAYDALLEVTDSGLLAQAAVWAATDPRAADEAYNIANGDLFRWRELWPRLAAWFGLPAGDPLPMSLADVMADKGPVWDALVAEHDLEPTPYADVSSWTFADFVLGWDYDVFADGLKARRAGFHAYVETEAMFIGLFEQLRAARVIP
jgi:nucleoside-diphosphate-sugar epimerase